MEQTNKVPFFKLLIARGVNYAFWLLILTLIEDQTSLYLSPVLLWALAPIMMVVFGTLSARYLKTTLGFKLLRIELEPPVDWKSAFLAALPWTKPDNLRLKDSIPVWRYGVALLIGASALFLQFNDPVYGFSSKSSMNNSSWVQYTHDEKGFSVYFPDEPNEVEKPLNPTGDSGLNYTEMSAKEKKKTYSLSYLKMPKKWGLAGDNTILKVSLDLIVKNTTGAVLVERKMTDYQGHKAIDYTLMSNGKEISGRLLIHQNILYKLNIESPKGSSNKEAREAFLASFSIK
jgi:hypothetical protein